MKSNRSVKMKYIAMLTGLVLAAQPSLTVMAATNYATYGEYRAGSFVEAQNSDSIAYTIISIQDEEDLVQLAKDCELDSWSHDKLIQLDADINLQKHLDISIPSFGGIFDGNGHRISNLEISRQGSAVGLFRYVQECGSIKNLLVEGKIAPQGSQSQVGGIVGINYGQIYNCSFSGYVSGDTEIGGIAGVNGENGEIRKCQSGAIIIGNHSVGGIVGSNHGILNNCSNVGDVNTYSTEVTYDLSDITMENIEDLNSTSNVAAHTDSGGIAGISDGKIYYCSNSGTIGYNHVGYNTGGIVGRLHQGYLQNCTNTGHVLGRKDVGGIVGQMEPFLEIQYISDKLQELDKETDVFLDLLDTAHQDMRTYGKQATTLTKALTTSLKNASNASSSLLTTVKDLWYIYNQELNGVNNDVKALNDEWNQQKEEDQQNGNVHDVTVSSGDLKDEADKVLDEIQNNSSDQATDSNENTQTDTLMDKVTDAANDLKAQNTSSEGSTYQVMKLNSTDITDLGNLQDKVTDTVDGVQDQIQDNIPQPTATPNVDEVKDQITSPTIQVPDDTASYEAALRRFLDSTTTHLGNMIGASTDRSGGVNDDLNTLNDQMNTAGDQLEQLADVLEAGADKSGENMDALVAQAKVLRKLISEIRDDLFRYEGITIEDTSDEVADETDGTQESTPGAGQEKDDSASEEQTGDSDEGIYYDTTSFQQGKITLCVNQGLIEADTNVGGIVGQVSTEYDFDPEDDITLTGTESFDIEQTVKAIIRDSRNLGDVTAKKDCAGGIVGKADFGAVISCESYGNVVSTSGSYVGGVAGTSSYAIRSCYAMGELSGKNYVGGIAGKGSDIFYSYAYNTLVLAGECEGTIAGQEADDGILAENYYVVGDFGGIDSIGYQGGATPLTYEEFCNCEGLPEAFYEFTITFMADGQELASYQCRYGDAISSDQIPSIPEKEGYYGVWEEYDFDHVTGNKVLEVEYNKWTTTIAGSEKDESGKDKILVKGEFLPGTELVTAQKDGGTQISLDISEVEKGGQSNEQIVEVRVLCEDPKASQVNVLINGSYTAVDSSVMGSYLVFEMDMPGTFMVTTIEKNSMIRWYGAGAIAVVVVIILILLIKKAGKRGNKRAESKNAEQTKQNRHSNKKSAKQVSEDQDN